MSSNPIFKRVAFSVFAGLLLTPCQVSVNAVENRSVPTVTTERVPQKIKIVAEDYNLLMQKIKKDFLYNPQKTEVEEALKRFDADDGCFTDIDYRATHRTLWEPVKHLERLLVLTNAYVHPDSPYSGNETLYSAIVKGLDYWYEVNPQCNNWWFNQIGEPHKLGLILVLMRSGKQQVPVDIEKKNLDRMAIEGGDPARWTGANRVDISLHWIYRACLTQNADALQHALKNAYSPLIYTTKEGFQHDNSYFQHGPQLYIGAYGDAILKGILRIASYTENTKFAGLDKDKLALLSKFVRETYYNTIRGKNSLFTVLGRSVSRPNALIKDDAVQYARSMMEFDGEHKREYEDIIARMTGGVPASYGVQPLHTHFFRGDYTLHVRPDYTFDVRMVSNRTARLECGLGNGENLKGHYFSDGGTNIVTTGKEYENIFPIWNWAQIPGITSPQVVTKPNPNYITMGTSEFCGGVSDSIYGATGYVYYDSYDKVNTGGNKSWFFFDDEVVCMGNIYSTSDYKVFTTINQCFKADDDIVMNDGRKMSKLADGQFKGLNARWIYHNHVGYLFPEGGNIWLNNQLQKGSWYDINTNHAKEELTGQIFSLGFDHGLKPKEASYAYIVVPTVSSAKAMRKYQSRKAIQVVSHTKDIQSVYHKILKIWQVVFFKEGILAHHGVTVEAKSPCAIMLKELSGGKYELHIADPAQKQKPIEVTVTIPGSGEQRILADFSGTGIYAGQSKSFKF